jgi:GH25 family lysozyme M1 (1,4-beta-N-acetylmuramidase)
VLRGFDVSHWQGSVDWADLKRRYGIAFGACKAT